MIEKIFATKRSRMLLMMFFDVLACLISSFVALWVRFDFSIDGIPYNYGYNAVVYAPIYVIGVLVVFICFKLYFVGLF